MSQKQSMYNYSSYEEAEKTSSGVPMYGMDVDMMRKRDSKRGDQAEQEAQAWVEGVLGIHFDAPFEEFLKDGIVLCNLINAIKPGSVARINRMKQPFMQMENIEAYCNACRTFGIKEFELFRTVDLFEGKNIPAVVNNLHALGRACQKIPGFRGPSLGARMAEPTKTNFTPEQLGEAAGAIPRLTGDMNKKLEAGGWNTDISNEVVRSPQFSMSSESTPPARAAQQAAASGAIPLMQTLNRKLEPSGWNTGPEVVKSPQFPSGEPKPSSSSSSSLSPPPPPPAPAAQASSASASSPPPPPPPASDVAAVTSQAAQLTLDDLERLASLKERGIITQEEFDAKKRQILGL